jgi:hypothetical protein
MYFLPNLLQTKSHKTLFMLLWAKIMNGKSGILTGYFKETSISFLEAYDILSILKIKK